MALWNLNDGLKSQIRQAFKEIHELNVVHNHVHRRNILIGRKTEKVWIVDFERAEILENDEKKEKRISSELEELFLRVKWR